MIISRAEALSELGLLLGPGTVFLKYNHHFAEASILLVNSGLPAHLDDLADLIFGLAGVVMIQAVLHLLLIWHCSGLIDWIFGLQYGSGAWTC